MNSRRLMGAVLCITATIAANIAKLPESLKALTLG
jgi:hypothetical protein